VRQCTIDFENYKKELRRHATKELGELQELELSRSKMGAYKTLEFKEAVDGFGSEQKDRKKKKKRKKNKNAGQVDEVVQSMDVDTLIDYIESKRDINGQKTKDGKKKAKGKEMADKMKQDKEFCEKYKPYIQNAKPEKQPEKKKLKKKNLESTMSTNYTASAQSTKYETKLSPAERVGSFSCEEELDERAVERQVEEFRRKLESEAGAHKKLRPNVSNDWIDQLRVRLAS